MESIVIAIAIDGPIERADIPALCERVRARLEGVTSGRVICDVGELSATDAATVDALARLQLIAHRLGLEVRLGRSSASLVELLTLMGLREILPSCGPLDVELDVQPGRQPE